ncbi:MAG: nitroreductase family protein, partial [Dehalococcoidales bacterium]|nr:nitroreductase family protein [Dehalococcoidales bacterium]
MEFKELENLIKSRRSIRRWQDKKVPEKLLLQAIELATWAPSGGNQQNWRFYVILNPNTIGKIADAVQTSVNQMAKWPEIEQFGAIAKDYGKFIAFFRNAPAAIAVAASRYQSLADQILAVREKSDPKAAEMRQARNIANSRIQSVSAAFT